MVNIEKIVLEAFWGFLTILNRSTSIRSEFVDAILENVAKKKTFILRHRRPNVLICIFFTTYLETTLCNLRNILTEGSSVSFFSQLLPVLLNGFSNYCYRSKI